MSSRYGDIVQGVWGRRPGVMFPQGKLGGCTVISCDVTLNYTTYYLNLGQQCDEGGRLEDMQAGGDLGRSWVGASSV